MKIIVKLILGTGFISLLLAACKKDEPVIVKTPTEKFIGKYTVYDTLVSVPGPECYTTDLHDEISI